MAQFKDRREAGRRLARRLEQYAGRDDAVVLALVRGGVTVAYEVAEQLDLPLDIFLVRKLGVPGQEELAMGAIASGGVRVMNENVVNSLNISEDDIERVGARERKELQRREEVYRGDREPPELEGKTAILVDDGLATGATMRAAVQALRQRGPAEIVVAVPTGPAETARQFEGEVDDFVCLTTPTPFFGVGGSYRDFSQVQDDEVCRLLEQAGKRPTQQE